MSPLNIKLSSYRAFRDETQLTIKPLTLLFGQNQVGKSTLLRFLPLLSDSLQQNAGPLDLGSPSLRGAQFKELGWMGRSDFSMTPEFAIASGLDHQSPFLRMQFSDDKGPLVNRIELGRGERGNKFRVSLAAAPVRTGKTYSAGYAGKYRGADWNGNLSFVNLIPDGLPQQAQEIVDLLKEALAPLRKMQWLRANRVLESGSAERASQCCKPDGSDLASQIQGAHERSILDPASLWLSNQDGLASDIVLQSTAAIGPHFLISSPGKELLPLHLAGEGLRSLLPILLSACWAESEYDSRPSLLAIEEPEAHLHPTVQVALFDRLLETVKAGVPLVLETHSVYMLRAMQVAVLEGKLSSDDVSLNWVSQGKDGVANVARIEVGPDATLAGWRPFVFEKEQEMARRIIDLRWKGQGL
ncbi:AAA family ATPase [Massilia varians]|uniref:AAA family ATPase n=1 Tax=Massilia varians TaxID=457921 RepID=UPI002553F760|nr:AAA family ATPase [Massilia varians]MDK6076916.1 AAA family ATPase [Massilia varians]